MALATRFRSAAISHLLGWFCLLLGGLSFCPNLAQATAMPLAAAEHATPGAGAQLRIAAGTTYSGTIVVSSDSVTISNYGTLAGTIVVSSGVKGTVINNLGAVTSQTIYLNSPTTINNGSVAAPAASWTGYIGDNFGKGIIINNFASFAGEIYTLPGGTLHNQRGATWAGYIHHCPAALAITNDGTWQAPLAATGRLHVVNNGLWDSVLVANGPVVITNAGSWPAREASSQVAAQSASRQ
jgi:hypothetical protein